MNILTVFLTPTTTTTNIIDKYISGYDTMIISSYYTYRSLSGQKYSVDLVIGGNPPKPPNIFHINPLSISFTQLKQNIRNLNHIIEIRVQFKEMYPDKEKRRNYTSEILTFFDNADLTTIDSEEIHYFDGIYYLNAQSSSMHYSTGYGDTSYFRISGFRVHRIEPQKINWDILKNILSSNNASLYCILK